VLPIKVNYAKHRITGGAQAEALRAVMIQSN
jgi:hypothetical protein